MTYELHVNKAGPKEIGTPNYHYYNNLFLCQIIFKGTHAMPNWHDAGNVYLQSSPSPEWQKVIDTVFASGFKSQSRFLAAGSAEIASPENGNFEISSGSVAVNAGTDLSKFNLPGASNESTPDAGALKRGEKMFKVYRSPSEVKVAPAGFFPEPYSKITLPTQYAKGFLNF